VAIGRLYQREKVSCRARRSAISQLLVVALDGSGGPNFGRIRVLTGIASGPALAQQIPALIELDLEGFQPGRFGVVEAGVGVGPLEVMLFLDEPVDRAQDRFVIHWSESVLPPAGKAGRAH
jgi:hypothetical protein